MFPLALLNSSTPPIDSLLTLALLHFDGTNNTQVFTDSSPNNQNIIANNSNTGVYLSNTWAKFGSTSCFFDGASFVNYLSTPAGSGYLGGNIGASDWQIDCFIRPSSVSGQKGIFNIYSGSTYTPINLKLVSGVLTLQVQTIDNSNWQYSLTHQTVFVANTEYHIRALRKDGRLRLFVDGVEASSSGTNIGTESLVNAGAGNFYIGSAWNYIGGFPQQFHGYIDEFRIRKEAEYTGNFTPPTSAFTY